MGRQYTVAFSAVTKSVATDVFQLEALVVPAVLHYIKLTQSSDLGDAESEGLEVIIRRVTDAVTGSVTPAPIDAGDAPANADANINQVTQLSTGAQLIDAEGWNILTPYEYIPLPEHRPTINVGDALTCNVSAPTDAITLSGVLIFEEIGG